MSQHMHIERILSKRIKHKLPISTQAHLININALNPILLTSNLSPQPLLRQSLSLLCEQFKV
jgi:hypothetical protein